MTVRLDGEVIRLEGACLLEEAEALARLLQAPGRQVDLAACEGLHGAVLQALLAFRPPLAGAPQEPFLRDFLIPALQAADRGGAGATSPAAVANEGRALAGARGRSPS